MHTKTRPVFNGLLKFLENDKVVLFIDVKDRANVTSVAKAPLNEGWLHCVGALDVNDPMCDDGALADGKYAYLELPMVGKFKKWFEEHSYAVGEVTGFYLNNFGGIELGRPKLSLNK